MSDFVRVGLYILPKEIIKRKQGRTCWISLSKRLRHNGLLVPHKPPFGTYSVSFCPVCIPSFEIAFFFFFPIFCFLWKRYFYWYCEVQLSFQGLSEIKSQSFRKNHKSIFTFYAFKNTYANRQIPAGLHI